MDRPNLFMEDNDFNICLSWICDSTDGQTYSISDHFGKKLKRPENMSEKEWFEKTMDIFNWKVWEDTVGYKHDYRVDDPAAKVEAERMVKELNDIIDRVNIDPDYLRWDSEGYWVLRYKEAKDAPKNFSVKYKYHGSKRSACKDFAGRIVAVLGAGRGESWTHCNQEESIAKIADCLLTNGWCQYAGLDFHLDEITDDEGVWSMGCKKNGEEYFMFIYRGKKSIACQFSADLVISELGDGDGENGGKGSLKNCIDDIADCFMGDGCYHYADCIFTFHEVTEEARHDIA